MCMPREQTYTTVKLTYHFVSKTLWRGSCTLAGHAAGQFSTVRDRSHLTDNQYGLIASMQGVPATSNALSELLLGGQLSALNHQ